VRLRSLLLPLLLATAALPAAAHASDVIVQGTTDVRDAGLLDDVITPGFKLAYPQYKLKYVAVGSGQALTNAEADAGDAVLTHSPDAEQQFVKAGYSATPFGPPVFYSDYVIVGPKDDPAHVFAQAPHDAVRAFELIALAGAAGKANFVSRGDDSGTNAKELDIWKLTSASLASSGEPGAGNNDASWYHKANAGQAATVQVAEQCPFKGGGCYDITDRGTFNRLAKSGSVGNLQVVSDTNDAAARGGRNLLLNEFRAYVVNPRKVHSVNVAGAKAFVDYLHSPAFRSKLPTYPSAAQPAFSVHPPPRSVSVTGIEKLFPQLVAEISTRWSLLTLALVHRS
jgi:tungstate transport system substrate-binding protein